MDSILQSHKQSIVYTCIYNFNIETILFFVNTFLHSWFKHVVLFRGRILYISRSFIIC